jgi:hypothetical protein
MAALLGTASDEAAAPARQGAQGAEGAARRGNAGERQEGERGLGGNSSQLGGRWPRKEGRVAEGPRGTDGLGDWGRAAGEGEREGRERDWIRRGEEGKGCRKGVEKGGREVCVCVGGWVHVRACMRTLLPCPPHRPPQV